LISVIVALGVTGVAHAATIFQINGGGNGHGIGMSQYGAYGYALHGASYQFILGHYYQGTALGQTDPNQRVRVLIGTGQAQFSGASAASASAGGSGTASPGTASSGGASSKAPGSRTASTNAPAKLDPSLTYSVRVLPDGSLGLFKPTGKRLAKFSSSLNVTGPGPLNLAGHGPYRGSLQFSAAGNRVQTVDVIGLDDYVRGVIAAEMPASWPMAALEAQAVAARTYALSSNVGGNGYELYSDTRSQMYGGVNAETAASDAAVSATRGQIVTYQGTPATTYFFSSSGGHTEDIENVWLGAAPQPWLKGVADPYDSAGGDPYHRWSVRMTLAAAQKKLGRLVRGRLRGIRVTQRGVSPRVVDAQVVGTRGTTAVTGPQLQSVFGLMSTYMRFTTISALKIKRIRAARDYLKLPPLGVGTVTGSVYPAGRNASVQIQIWRRNRWRAVEHVAVASDGSYTVALATGRYRAVYAGAAGPTITIG
jgi:stage II sporulation protein D